MRYPINLTTYFGPLVPTPLECERYCAHQLLAPPMKILCPFLIMIHEVILRVTTVTTVLHACTTSFRAHKFRERSAIIIEYDVGDVRSDTDC